MDVGEKVEALISQHSEVDVIEALTGHMDWALQEGIVFKTEDKERMVFLLEGALNFTKQLNMN